MRPWTLCGLVETYDHRPVLLKLLRVRSDQALDEPPDHIRTRVNPARR
ncbi:hypothetical protein [Micromonospora sp. DT233]